jgi:hypothetical protein
MSEDFTTLTLTPKEDVFVAFDPEEHDIVDLSAFAAGWEYYEPNDTRIDTAIASLKTQLSTKGTFN